MKILMVSEDVPHLSMGGAGRHAVTLAKYLFRIGHDVDFLGNGIEPYDSSQGDIVLPGRFFPDLTKHYRGWKEVKLGFFNPLRRPVIGWHFARAIMRHAMHYDVVHYHGHFPLLACYIPRNINFVQTRHDQGSDCLTHVRFRNGDVCRDISSFTCAECISPNPKIFQTFFSTLAVLTYRKLVARAFLRHKTIFVSDMLRKNFSRAAGMRHWGDVIHNFVEFDALRSFAFNKQACTGMIEVFISSKLYAPKGVSVFLEHIKARNPQNMRITIAGDSLNQGEFVTRFSNERIVFLGWRPYNETMQRMSTANVIVVPSLCEESCSTVILEGLSMGKQILALARGGTPELLKYERYPGQLTLFDNIEELVESLLTIDTHAATFHATDDTFGADVSVLLDNIINIYISDINQ